MPVQLQTFPTAGLFALLIENPLHAGSVLGKDKHTESFVKKAEQFQSHTFICTEAQAHECVSVCVYTHIHTALSK